MGIADIPPCKPFDMLCWFTRNAARVGAYNECAPRLCAAPKVPRLNLFLTSINNEAPVTRNATYAAQLDTLVLVLFARDRTIAPKESAWFAS